MEIDRKSILTTFGSTFLFVFLAELGDKTQLATLALAANSRLRWVVFVAASLALVVITFLTVLACELLLKFVEIRYIKLGSGLLFLLLGTIILLGK